MDHAYIEEHNLIERYALGRLSPEQQSLFEEHFATCPECLEGVEVVQDLGSALRSVAAEDAESMPSPKVILPWPQRYRSFLPLAAAAILLLAFLPSAWLTSRNRGLSGELERLRQPHANMPAIVLDNLRDAASAARPPVLALPAGEPWLTIALEVGVGDPGTTAFDVALENAGGHRLWRGEGLAPTPWGVLSLTLPTAHVPEGSYRLIVTARDNLGREEPVGTFAFEVSPP